MSCMPKDLVINIDFIPYLILDNETKKLRKNSKLTDLIMDKFKGMDIHKNMDKFSH